MSGDRVRQELSRTAEVESILRHFKAETVPSNSNRTVDFEMEAF